MHATRTPLRTWFWAAYLVATHHRGISAKQLQRRLGLSRYETAWLDPAKAETRDDRSRARPFDSWEAMKTGSRAASTARRR
jgi:hypothetical protein